MSDVKAADAKAADVVPDPAAVRADCDRAGELLAAIPPLPPVWADWGYTVCEDEHSVWLRSTRFPTTTDLMTEEQAMRAVVAIEDMADESRTLLPRLAAHCKALLAENERLRAVLSRHSPGTPAAILDAVSEFAERECGHNPLSARHGFSSIVEWVLEAKNRLGAMEVENERLRAAVRQAEAERDGMRSLRDAAVVDAESRVRAAEDREEVYRRQRDKLMRQAMSLEAERDKLRDAIKEHHAQKADDRCIEDDDRLYAAAGLPPCDRRVGDKSAMLKNCERFIERRCEGGGWPTYVELEAERDALLRFKQYVHARLDAAGVTADPESPHKAEGCRIGGRLDEVLGERDKLRAELDQYAEVIQRGKRLPAPDLAQDPAFAAFTLGQLEAERDKLRAENEDLLANLDWAGEPEVVAGCELELLRKRVAELEAELKLRRPLTPAEAEQALAEAEAAPLSGERIAEIVRAATDPAGRVTNGEQAQMAVRIGELEAALRGIFANPYGCLFCDSGTLRRRVDGREPFHTDDCPFAVAEHFAAKPEGGA